MMLDLDREWGQPPGWSLALSGAEQAVLIGHRRARQPAPGGRRPGGGDRG